MFGLGDVLDLYEKRFAGRSNAALISASASPCEILQDLNLELQPGQIPMGVRGGFTLLSLRFCI